MTSPERGSSPRVRGSHENLCEGWTAEGIIPAGAGLTRPACSCGASPGDHPRGCGAHFSSVAPSRTSAGSSPRVRGSLYSDTPAKNAVGIIPAGAGLTYSELWVSCWCWDHPRGCGAHTTQSTRRMSRAGSSPRVRGSRLSRTRARTALGIIPAGAGLTLLSGFRQRIQRDHPRGCGAHCHSCASLLESVGSSPRVRGSQGVFKMKGYNEGIIPAGAGLTCRKIHIRQCDRDHPRGCGAHLKLIKKVTNGRGSSPRVRGSPIDGSGYINLRGIIPAGAGLT